jgi:HAD superfamily phosphatase (TIGR01668 family)
VLKRLITPNLIVRHVGDIAPTLLVERGIRAVISDLDNTLVEYRGEAIADEVAAWLMELKAAGVGVCIASNTRRLSRLSRVAAAGGMLHVPGNAGKPGTGGLRRALSLLGTTPEETAMVGDQVFTDIVAGNRLGLTTILVNPLSPREFIGTRLVSRPAERLILRGPLRRVR